MVDKNKNLIFVAFNVMIPSLQSFNNSQRFQIVSFILYLSINHFPKKKLLGAYNQFRI